MGLFDGLINIVTAKKPGRPGGATITPDFFPVAPQLLLPIPRYDAFLQDILETRREGDSRAVLKTLFRQDPDLSSAVNGYLTLANTEMMCWAEDEKGTVDPVASADLYTIIKRLTRQTDYTQGFTFKQALYQVFADLRYMALLRGGISMELILDRLQNPDSLRMVDLATIWWHETAPGNYKPAQLMPGQGLPIPIDSPLWFISFYRRDPTTMYADSNFVSAINSMAARQQVINDLYRIMQLTGFPRIDISLLEAVIIKNAPANVRNDATALRNYIDLQLSQQAATFSSLRSDQSLVHTDSVSVKILNDKNPGAAIDVTSVIETLNAQNQAGLKTMATVLGRGAAGANTGSVEARLAAMFADELNEPIAELFEKMLSFCLHQKGYQGFANVKFRPAELRPDTELEPQRLLKANRLRQDLSDGIITDAEYTLEMYGRLPNTGAPILSGTGFLSQVPGGDDETGAPHPSDVSPNVDPLGRSISPDRTKMTKSNQPKTWKPPKNTKSGADGVQPMPPPPPFPRQGAV